jgi:ATP-dependent phosphofructokinase / diphosphate-dependent phosphofructokinase
MEKYNVFYAQSGGPTTVLNASACGVIETARQHNNRINTVFAGQYGILGAIEEALMDTAALDTLALQQLKYTPGAAFGSCRYKLQDFTLQPQLYERIFQVFQAHHIRYFLYNGGGDSQDTTCQLAKYSHQNNYPLTCIGIPKTIDNDIPCTDQCPGFGSVAKYVATAVLEVSLDVRAMHRNSTKVFILEVMGRHSGWIAAAAGLAFEQTEDAPHLILFPEVLFDSSIFLSKVSTIIKKYGYCIIVAAEGIRDRKGQFLSAINTKDAFQHTQLGGVAPKLAEIIKVSLQVKYHWAILDYLQRSAGHLTAQVDVKQAYALGKAAVELALQGNQGYMPTLVRQANHPYTWSIGKANLTTVANQEKCLPNTFISRDGFHITDSCRDYLAPLIQGESYPIYRNGLPYYWTKQLPLISKQLAAFSIESSPKLS